MKDCLQLYINGVLLAEIDLCMPEHNGQLSFEQNCNIRYAYLEYEREKFRIKHLRKILKFQNEYEIYFKAESKMNYETDFSIERRFGK